MSLRLIYGRAGSGKSYFCLNDIKSKLNDTSDIPLILLIPEQFSLQAEKNLIKTVGSGGIMRAEVLSFRRMAYRVFGEVGGITRKHLNASGKCMLIYRIIDVMADGLKVFSKAVRQKGFVNTVSDTIAEFKRYNITPQVLDGVCESIDDDHLKEKLMEISAIYDKFEETLHEKYLDSDDDLTELARKLAVSRQFDGAEIWLDEFSGFTPQEYKVIEELLKKARRINVSLCTDCVDGEQSYDGTEVFSPSVNTAKKLLNMAKHNGIDAEVPIELKGETYCRFTDSMEIRHLEHQFFSFPYSTYPHKTKDIRVFAAANPYTEIEDTARDIIGLCRDKGMRFRDVAVVSRDLPGYEKLISAIFTEYGIPCFIDRKKDISGHPLVQLILETMEIFTNNWSYESVFRYLKTGFTYVDRESIDIIENYVLACGIRGNMWTRDEYWDFRLNPGFDERPTTEYEKSILNKVNDIRQRITGPLADFHSKVKGRKKPGEICTALYELLCEIDVPERLERFVEGFKEAGELDLANEYSQVWNIVMEVLNQIVEVIGDENIGIERFARILTIGFGEYKVGLIPPALDQVLVGSIERSKSHEISALYILGVNDGIFPAASRDEGVLSDRDREILFSKGVELAQDTRVRAFEEQYLIYTALTTAGKYLRLSYPIADHEGRAMRPSTIISRLKRIFPGLYEYSNIISKDTDEADLTLVAGPASTFNRLVSEIREQADGRTINSLWSDVYRWFIGNEEWRVKCRTALSGLSYSNKLKYLSYDKVKKLYGNPLNSSISKFENFAACPFSYYLQYGLNVKDRKIFKLNPPDIGTFMHSVIDKFSKQLSGTDMTWRTLEKDACEEIISGIVNAQLQNMPGSILNSSKRYKYLTVRLKRVLTKTVWLIAEHIKRSGFEPIGYEMDFGGNGKFPPIMLELSHGEKICLTGRIDRIDAMQAEEGTYLRIVDYKSGSKAFKLADMYYGLQIQLITYLDAIWENKNMDMPGPILPGGILYMRLDDPIIRSESGTTEEEIEKAVMKQLRMKGLLLADVKLIKEMDRQIDGESLIIPARLNKDGVLGRSSAATASQFELLRRHVKRLLLKMGEEMLKGNVSIKPYKKKRMTPCTYCNYLSVCQFDSTLKDNNYRIINDLKDDEVWELLKNGEKEPEGTALG